MIFAISIAVEQVFTRAKYYAVIIATLQAIVGTDFAISIAIEQVFTTAKYNVVSAKVVIVVSAEPTMISVLTRSW